jgi:magnesium chelatase family protein
MICFLIFCLKRIIMHAKVFSAATVGIDAKIVEVEVDLALGLIQFYIVGLPDTAIKESSKRIHTALKNSGIRLPAKRIIVNLAPADLKKEGTLFDLPIAVGILCADGHIELTQEFLQETLFLGELSLDGGVRGIKGALAVAYDAHLLGKKRLIVPKANACEAALIQGLEIIGVDSIEELVAHMRGERIIEPTRISLEQFVDEASKLLFEDQVDFAHVKGQQHAKRALQIAAAGRHNIIFIGPPGSGKSMLARCLRTIMPPLTFDEILQTSKIYSVSGKLDDRSLVVQRPFRNPHHTISQAGLVGGGSYPQPGEISLAHNGILFLDELTEFKRTTLEVLRQPLEHHSVSIARAQQSITFPSSFLFIAALNPCPCGFWGDKRQSCTCSNQHIARYMEKLSGPLLDRIDLHVHVQSVDYSTIKDSHVQSTSSAQLYVAVERAVARQHERFGNKNIFNSFMNPDMISRYCLLTPAAETVLKKAFDVLHLSMRGYHKILKVARTIADLQGVEYIDVAQIQEAVMYRSFDRSGREQK